MRFVRAMLVALGLAVSLTGCRSGSPYGPPASAEIRFVDVTREAGIDFRHTHGGGGHKYIVETNGSGAAWLDYDGDGRQDLFLVNCKPLPGTPHAPGAAPGAPWAAPGAAPGHPTSKLYRNRGDGSFEDVTPGSGLDVESYGQGVTAADYDADGDPDLLITCLGPNRLFRNDGGGKFTDVAAAAGLRGKPGDYHAGAAWLDFDRDGWLDVFVARYMVWTPATDPKCEAPGGLERYCPPWTSPRARCLFFRNLGNGRFADATAKTGAGAVAGYWFQPFALDYDRDGWPDVAVISDGTPTALFRNLEGKRFQDMAAESALGLSDRGSWKSQMGIDAADWRNDGRESVLIGNFSGERLSLFDPNPPGLYTDIADRVGMGQSSLFSLTFGVAFLDADRDGWRDAFIANGHIDDYIERFEAQVTYAQLPLFYRNMQGKWFEEIGSRAGPAFSQKMVARGCAVADYDGDGDPDLVVTENNRPAHLFRNDTPAAGRSLRVVLRGKSPNRDAVGARVEVTAGGLRQTQWVRAGGHYFSQSELPLTFGLGRAAAADLRVTWPDGTTTERTAVPADRPVEIRQEPQGGS